MGTPYFRFTLTLIVVVCGLISAFLYAFSS